MNEPPGGILFLKRGLQLARQFRVEIKVQLGLGSNARRRMNQQIERLGPGQLLGQARSRSESSRGNGSGTTRMTA